MTRQQRDAQLVLGWICVAAALLLAGLLLDVCASWQSTARASLDAAHRTGIVARELAPSMCRPALEDCIAAKSNPCPALQRCQAARAVLVKACDSLQRAVLLGWAAVASDDQPIAQRAVSVALEAIGQLREGIATWGGELP